MNDYRFQLLQVEASAIGYTLISKEELSSIEENMTTSLFAMNKLLQQIDSSNSMLIEVLLSLAGEDSESALFVKETIARHLGGSQ